jgi:Zn-dependent peptidase ImmA (M78 family)/transcriptional regulator with XRE-family HTH domain
MSEDPTTISADPIILGRRLREARRERGLTQSAVAEDMGIARTSLVAIEKGERSVRPEEFVRLARIYGRSLDELLRKSPPLEEFALQFRVPPFVTVRNEDIDRTLIDFQRMIEDYLELERLTQTPLAKRYPPIYDFEGLRPNQAGEHIAQLERNRLSLGDGPVTHLPSLLETEVGLRIFRLPLPSKVAGFFGFTDEAGGCIAINAKHPPERQLWSLAHEYGHFLTRRYRSEVTILHAYERQPASERFAETFAEYFLMPASSVMRRFNDFKKSSPKGPTPALLMELASVYGVSLQAMILRLESLRLVPLGTWDRLESAGFKVNEARQLLDMPTVEADSEAGPLRYRLLAVAAYRDGLITEGQFSKFLRLDRVSARRVADDLGRQAFVNDEGALREVSVMFNDPSDVETG